MKSFHLSKEVETLAAVRFLRRVVARFLRKCICCLDLLFLLLSTSTANVSVFCGFGVGNGADTSAGGGLLSTIIGIV